MCKVSHCLMKTYYEYLDNICKNNSRIINIFIVAIKVKKVCVAKCLNVIVPLMVNYDVKLKYMLHGLENIVR